MIQNTTTATDEHIAITSQNRSANLFIFLVKSIIPFYNLRDFLKCLKAQKK